MSGELEIIILKKVYPKISPFGEHCDNPDELFIEVKINDEECSFAKLNSDGDPKFDIMDICDKKLIYNWLHINDLFGISGLILGKWSNKPNIHFVQEVIASEADYWLLFREMDRIISNIKKPKEIVKSLESDDIKVKHKTGFCEYSPYYYTYDSINYTISKLSTKKSARSAVQG